MLFVTRQANLSKVLTFLPHRVSSSGKRHSRMSSSLDGTMRRLRLSDDASLSPSSADLEPGLPRRPLTDRPSSRLASTSQAGPSTVAAVDVTRVYTPFRLLRLSRLQVLRSPSQLKWFRCCTRRLLDVGVVGQYHCWQGRMTLCL